MKRLLISLVGILLVGCVASADVVKGIVRNLSGEPIHNAQVAALDNDTTLIATVFTDREGIFNIESPKRVSYICVSEYGYKDYVYDNTNSRADAFVTIELEPVGQQLEEVVVNANRTVMKNGDTTFYPSQSEKANAAGGVDVLRNLGAAELFINPINKDISTISGEGVAYFINGVPATKDDVENINTLDIKKIELLKSPTNPRYNGARVVLDYILVKYEIGGYTKLNLQQNFINILGIYKLYSKLAYKDMTYDISLGYSYSKNKHNGFDETSSYRFKDVDLTRTARTLSQEIEQSIPSATFRATYAKNDVSITNTVGVMLPKTPIDRQSGEVSFSSADWQNSTFAQANKLDNKGAEWNGQYLLPCSKGFTLSISPYVNYYDVNQTQTYVTASGDYVDNQFKEKALVSRLSNNLSKSIGNHNIGALLTVGYNYNIVDYNNETSRNVIQKEYYVSLGLNYNLSLGNFNWYLNGWVSYQNTNISNRTYKDWIPHVFTYASYQFNEKNSLFWSGEYSTFANGASMKSPVMVMQNEVDAIEGNPDLKNYQFLTSTLSYNFSPVRSFSVSAYAKVSHFHNPAIYYWKEAENRGLPIMVREYGNSGTLTTSTVGAAAPLWLFNYRLLVQPSVDYSFYHQTGLHAQRKGYTSFNGFLQLSVGKVYLSAYYQAAGFNMSQYSISRHPHFYYLAASYRYRNFLFYLKLNNIFNSSYRDSSIEMAGANYAFNQQSFGTTFHRDINLTVTYTFNYGRKKTQESNLDQIGGANSAILR